MSPSIYTRAALSVGAVAIGVSLASCSPQAAAPSSSPAGAAPTPAPAASPAASAEADSPAAAYVDGEYSATGWYGSLPSHHDVTLTIASDVITGVEITTPAEDETSLGYQQRFAEALPAVVVGRNIDEIIVDRVAGSSGCSEGFMDALTQIKEQAAA